TGCSTDSTHPRGTRSWTATRAGERCATNSCRALSSARSPSTPRPLDRGRGVWHHPTPTPAPYARPGPHSKSGPSPRAWGLAKEGAPVCSMSRSIPTCVGLGNIPTIDVTPGTGPSPRAWGLATIPSRSLLLWRSIPTCVGLGVDCHGVGVRRAVHPHVRGARYDTHLL